MKGIDQIIPPSQTAYEKCKSQFTSTDWRYYKRQRRKNLWVFIRLQKNGFVSLADWVKDVVYTYTVYQEEWLQTQCLRIEYRVVNQW